MINFSQVRSMDDLYLQVGRSVLAGFSVSPIDFAATKKSQKCNPSRSHGCVRVDGTMYCISLNKKCRMGAKGKAKQVADYVKEKVGEVYDLGDDDLTPAAPAKAQVEAPPSPKPKTPKSESRAADRAVRGHLKKLSDKEAIKLVQSDLDAKTKEAAAIYRSVNWFTGGGYTVMRSVEQGKNTRAFSQEKLSKSELAATKKDVENVNKYLRSAPVFEGSIHRGMRFGSTEARNAFLKSVTENGGLELEAMSSFSSSKGQARNFADKNGVVMKVRNKSGVSVKAFSNYPTEDEVLCPKGAKYKVVGKPKRDKDGTILLELEEV